MAQLFDAQTKTVVEAPDNANLDPQRYQPVGDQVLQMVAPDGKAYNLPAKSAQDAVTNFGWKFPNAEQSQAFTQEDQAYQENQGAFKVGLESFKNQAMFGVPEIVDAHTQSAATQKGIARAKAESPVANVFGGGLGVLTNVAATEGVGALARGATTALQAGDVAAHAAETAGIVGDTADAAEHGVINAVGTDAVTPNVVQGAQSGISAGAREIAQQPGLFSKAVQSAKNSAIMGAAYSAPAAVAQYAYGDKDAAAENLLIGTGFGGLLGLGHGLFTAGLDKSQGLLSDLLTKHGALDENGQVKGDFFKNLADESDLQKLGISKADAQKLGKVKVANLIDTMNKDNLQNADRDTILAKNQEAGEAIKGHSEYLDSQFKFDRTPSQADKVAPTVAPPVTPEAPFVAQEHPDYAAYKEAYPGEKFQVIPAEPEVGQDTTAEQEAVGEHPDYTAYKEAYTGPKQTVPPPSEAHKVPEPEPPLLGTTSKPQTPEIGIAPTDLAEQVKKEVIEQRPALTRPLYEDDLKELNKIVEHISSYGEDRRHVTLQDIKNSFSSEYANTIGKPPGLLTNREKMIRQVYDIIKTKQEQVMSDSYNKLGMSEKGTQYLADKAKYAATSDLLKYGPQQFDNFGNPLTQKVVPYGMRNTFISRGAGAASSLLAAGLGHVTGISAMGGYFALRPVIDMVIHHALIDKGLNVSTKILRKLADNPETMQWVGAALTKDLWDKSVSKVASFPNIMLGKAAATAVSPIKSILGSEGTSGRTTDQQYDKLSQAVQNASLNPQLIEKQVQTMGAIFGHDPELQKLLAQKQFATIQYLAANLPKAPPAQPFTQNQPEVTALQKQNFLDKLEIANSPDNIVAHMKDGSLNDNHLQAMQTLYPKRYQQYLGQVLMMAYDPRFANLPNRTIRTFAQYAQNPALDPSLTTLPQDQAKFAPMPMPQGAPGKGGKSKGTSGQKAVTAKGAFNPDRFPSVQTNVSRLQYK